MNDADFVRFVAKHNDDSTNALLRDYCRAFHKPFFDIEDTSIDLTEDETRIAALRCLYEGKSRENALSVV
ncbi:hypothetical protein [Bifidobacterium bombi]|uniref:hypothetical protein n=1 Tax=Bifidobacterium bombi TaxID=471511 RepID=UPI0005C70976|nr:hypothetical protein [Bifidobacterium bombi]